MTTTQGIGNRSIVLYYSVYS